jgi:hypothetical protein
MAELTDDQLLEKACQHVRDKHQAVPAKELLTSVLGAKAATPAKMAELHSLLCLEPRLVYGSDGWGLRDWGPKPKVVKKSEPKPAGTVSVSRKRRLEPAPDVEQVDEADDEPQDEVVSDEVEETWE